jgi:hypothetical protein
MGWCFKLGVSSYDLQALRHRIEDSINIKENFLPYYYEAYAIDNLNVPTASHNLKLSLVERSFGDITEGYPVG